MRLYLDSNVLVSFVREEIDGAFNLRYKDAGDFFAACGGSGAVIVISNLFLLEVKRVVSLERRDVEELLGSFGAKILFSGKTDEQLARRISRETGLHLADASHVANALNSGSDCIITWNRKDFEKAKRIVPHYSPEEFIQTIQ